MLGINHAIKGIELILKSQRNFKIQSFIAVLVIIAGFSFQISIPEWYGVIFSISIVLIAEAVNTSIESMCNVLTEDYNSKIKVAKDISAGAVLLSTIASVIIGLIIFLPYLLVRIPEVIKIMGVV